MPYNPGGFLTISRINDITDIACYLVDSISIHLYIILRGSIASRFPITARTLAHPLLKPNLTTSAPGSFATGSLLEITRLVFHQLYIKHRTGSPTLF